MKKKRNKYIGEEIIQIAERVDEVIENFLSSGITDFIVIWTKDIENWAEKNSDEDYLEAVDNFNKWKDKEELKKLIAITKERHKLYLKHGTKRKNAFIAHNDGDPVAQLVKNVLHNENINPIIMQEHPNIGKTVIEKLKSFDFSIGIIILRQWPLLTTKRKKVEANDNVIMETGYCYGCFESIESVIILYDGKVNMPSNLAGVEYIKLDENWQYNLIKSLKARGLIDS